MDFEDVLFPDFDDIAVPPEPNEDSDRGKEAEQSQVTGQYLNAEKNCEFAANYYISEEKLSIYCY